MRFAGIFALTLSLLVVRDHTADACGVKMTVKSPGPRKAVQRSQNASNILIIGEPPPRLQRDLAAAGHRVDVANNPGAAKRETYAVVIVPSGGEANTARTKFPNAIVMVRSSDVASDLRTVETRVARAPVSASDRTLVAAVPKRQPTAAGPVGPTVVAAKNPNEGEGAGATQPPPTPKATPQPPKPAPPKEEPKTVAATVEPKPAETKPAPKPEEKPAQVTTTVKPREEAKPRPAAVVSDLREEVFFGLGGSAPQNARTLARAAAWLTKNTGVQVTVSGHADPTGTPEGNMALSQTRAERVRDALVEKGVDSSRITVEAFGDTKLKYGQQDGRNRRVAIEAKAEAKTE